MKCTLYILNFGRWEVESITSIGVSLIFYNIMIVQNISYFHWLDAYIISLFSCDWREEGTAVQVGSVNI